MIPKFSIQQMLLAMIAIGGLSACFAGAYRGSQIALGLSVGIVGLLIPFSLYAVFHWGCFAPARLSAVVSGRVRGASEKPPNAEARDNDGRSSSVDGVSSTGDQNQNRDGTNG